MASDKSLNTGDCAQKFNQRAFKLHVSCVLGMHPEKVSWLYREAREKGFIKTGPRGANGHVPSDGERRSLLLHIASRAIVNNDREGLPHYIYWNSHDTFETMGVIVEKHTGMTERVEISPAHVRSILSFGATLEASE